MLSELRLTQRTLGKSPGFVVVAVFTLALGIGVNAAMFGIVNALMLRGLPFPAQDRLRHIASYNRDFGTMGISHADFADFRAEQHGFEDIAGYDTRTFNLASGSGEPERVDGAVISPSGLTLLREPALLGRWFRAEDEQSGAAPVIVLGYSVWKNRFGADAAAVGQTVKVNGEWATIIGVAPKNFRFPEVADAWMPLKIRPNDKRDDRGFNAFGRLKDGVSPEKAQAELAAIARRIETGHQDTNKDVGVYTRKLHDKFISDDIRRMMTVMFGAVGLVLLIACANVANLLLARAAVRQKEIAIRTALGATRGQIVRLLLLEALALSVAGAALGLPLAYGLMAALRADLATKVIPYWMVFDLDAAGVGYVLTLAVLTCLIAGLWPAWQTSRADLNTVLKDSSRGSTGGSLSKFSRAMVVGEVVLSAVLLVLAALTVRSVVNAQAAELGYRPEGVFTSRVDLTGAGYSTGARQLDFYRELIRRLEARPEIGSVAVASLQPTWNNREQIEIEGQPRGGPSGSNLPTQFASRSGVSGNYFDTLGIKLIAGRTFDERDVESAPRAAIVSSRFAEKHWSGENPLGKRFVYGWGLNVKENDWLTVVGVVTPTLQGDFRPDMVETPQTYVPSTQQIWRSMTVFVRVHGSGDAAALSKVVRQVVHELDAEQPIFWPQTLDAMVADARFFKGLVAWIFGIFGGVALVLAAVGLYGVMSYSVSQRTQEIGVRMALGAEQGDVLAMILREGGLRLGVGLALGLVAAYFAGRLLAFTLYGVEPGDVAAFLTTFVALSVTGFIACLVPALRAVRVNPVEALRHD